MSKTSKPSPDRAILLRLIEQGYDKSAWHGPNLKGAIRRVSTKQAVWQAKPGRHCIAEIVVHCAYWKYAVRRRIRRDKRGSFPLKGSNWFTLPGRLTDAQWRDYVALLDEQHRRLREAIAAAPSSRLSTTRSGKSVFAAHVYGIALHDTYHTGQIRTLKVLHKQATGAKKTSRR